MLFYTFVLENGANPVSYGALFWAGTTVKVAVAKQLGQRENRVRPTEKRKTPWCGVGFGVLNILLSSLALVINHDESWSCFLGSLQDVIRNLAQRLWSCVLLQHCVPENKTNSKPDECCRPVATSTLPGSSMKNWRTPRHQEDYV